MGRYKYNDRNHRIALFVAVGGVILPAAGILYFYFWGGASSPFTKLAPAVRPYVLVAVLALLFGALCFVYRALSRVPRVEGVVRLENGRLLFDQRRNDRVEMVDVAISDIKILPIDNEAIRIVAGGASATFMPDGFETREAYEEFKRELGPISFASSASAVQQRLTAKGYNYRSSRSAVMLLMGVVGMVVTIMAFLYFTSSGYALSAIFSSIPVAARPYAATFVLILVLGGMAVWAVMLKRAPKIDGKIYIEDGKLHMTVIRGNRREQAALVVKDLTISESDEDGVKINSSKGDFKFAATGFDSLEAYEAFQSELRSEKYK